MFDKFIMLLFSFVLIGRGLVGVATCYFHGLFTYFYGVDAIVVSFGVLIIGVILLTNYIRPWIKWLPPNRLLYAFILVFIWELIVRESIVFFSALN